MIFGRKRKPSRAVEDETAVVETDATASESDDKTAFDDESASAEPVETGDEADDAAIDSAEDADSGDDDADSDHVDDNDEDSDDEDEDEDDEDSDDEDEVDVLDYRLDGPFDIDEVDLDADDVERIDFGALIITPFEGMELQLQVEEKSQAIQSALVVHEGSAIEIAIFAAPRSGGLAKEVLDELTEITREGGGQADVEDGPFGPELFRVLNVTTPEGQDMLHRSRIWLVEGPRWMLRAVLMGNAVDEGPGRELLEDFFRNLVVVRGSEAKSRGDLITLTMPKNLVAG